jgi:signal transduction histidine kinase
LNSLRARLALGLSLALVVLLGGQWLAIHYGVGQLLQRQAVTRLEHDLEVLLAGLTFAGDGTPSIDDGRLVPPYRRPYSGHYYQVLVGEQRLRSRSLWDTRLELRALPAGGSESGRLAGPRGEPLLQLAHGYRKGGRQVTIAVAEDLSVINAEARRLQWGLALLSAGMIVILLTVQLWLLRRGLSPLTALRREVQRLHRGEIAALDAEVPAEVRPLVAEINRLLGFMERRLQRSRHALGDLAHALKTPLTRLFQLVEEPGLPVDTAKELRRHVGRIRELAERELKRARLAGGGYGRRVELVEELGPLLDLFGRMYAGRGLALESDIPSRLVAPVDREDLHELAGNLIDNACKWARGRVRITVAADGDGISLTVEDDGPGCPSGRLEELTRRGSRLDENVAGHGLGLAIVGDLAADYGGELRFGESPLGGLRVSVRLPFR